MDLLSMDDDNGVNSSPPGSASGNRHRSGSSASAAGLSGEVLAEVLSCLFCLTFWFLLWVGMFFLRVKRTYGRSVLTNFALSFAGSKVAAQCHLGPCAHCQVRVAEDRPPHDHRVR